MSKARPATDYPPEPRQRVEIVAVRPAVDGGRYPIKRVVGEAVVVEADIIVDGHDVLAAVMKHRVASAKEWTEVRLEPLPNDVWTGRFTISTLQPHVYTVEAWIDRFASWARDLAKRVAADQDVTVDLRIGAQLIEEAATRAAGDDAERLAAAARAVRGRDRAVATATALGEELAEWMRCWDGRPSPARAEMEYRVDVDPIYARYSTWYEMFPRSCAAEPHQHGTLADCERLLPYVAAMGFDVLYLPPVHPIGRAFRKGKNNATTAGADDVGSPWAIGAQEGGHKEIHPQLGTREDFRRLVAAARKRGIELAMDLAYQCAPDHPYVREHPEWFRARPDGTIQYAENPPKKYQDIYPLDFECEQWRALWEELRSVVLHWIGHGVRIFRVDNPHTKSLRFWEWMIGSVRHDHPETIFLAEAFTRPKMMVRLAKIGFNQSYTYFAWRNAKWEIEEYFRELTQPPMIDFYRANLWPNTPDILTEHFQHGGRAAFLSRFVLAATLGASYGIYGPAFELCENRAREPGSEEYLDSEKYQIRAWNRDDPGSLRHLIARVNRIRREHPALHTDRGLRFLEIGNDQLLAFTKTSDDGEDALLVCVNLDVRNTQAGWLTLPLAPRGAEPGPEPRQAHDLLSGARYDWHGPSAYIELNPHVMPAHIFRLRYRVRSEHDFEYYV
ncbi:MAG: alpha-1,4-glucan--maltose-1-phosphate maltosyltransferase [Phycisphaerae bacterium]